MSIEASGKIAGQKENVIAGGDGDQRKMMEVERRRQQEQRVIRTGKEGKGKQYFLPF